MARPWKSKLLWSDEVLMCYETQSSCLSFMELEQQLEIPNDRHISSFIKDKWEIDWHLQSPLKGKADKVISQNVSYMSTMRLHNDLLRSRSVVNARKCSLGACGSLSDQLFSANTFRRICKIQLSTTAKSYSYIYSPALEPCRHHWDHNFFCGHTALWWLHLVARVQLKVRAVT